MGLRQAEIVIDCADHEVVVGFWSAALGWERQDINEQYVALVSPLGGGLPILFQKVPEPKVAKNRVHLDFRADSMADELDRLAALGARKVVEHSLGATRWTIMVDPEGNEFCVVQA